MPTPPSVDSVNVTTRRIHADADSTSPADMDVHVTRHDTPADA
jgi:hypothetical protein